MNKKLHIWLPLLFSITLILGMFFGYKLRDNMGAYAPSFWGRTQKSNLQEILQLIREKYVDQVSTDTLGADAINEMLSHLDPHSVYIPPSSVKLVNEDLQGNFEGVGIEYKIIDDTVTVITAINGGPAEAAGIIAGDQLIAANDSIIAGKKISSEEVRNFFRGPRGTTVKIDALRNGEKKQFLVQRGVIPSQVIEAAYMIAPETGFIKLGKFTGNSYELFMEQLEKLQRGGMKKLILDLRNNGGGILDDAVQMADEFLDNNKQIVYTEGKSSPRQSYVAKRPGLFEEGKLVLLVDEGSASASEVLAGAVQDWDRAIIIGRRTFGKGLVQEQFNLSDGGALRLSVTRYYTPLGRSIQKPYLNKGIGDYRNEVNGRYKDGEAFHEDSIRHKGKTFKTAKAKVLYDSEGITPDYYIPADSATLALGNRMPGLSENIMNLALRYYKRNLSVIQKLESPAALQQLITGDNSLLSTIEAALLAKYKTGTEFNAKEKASLQQQFGALIARIRWGIEGYHQYMNIKDPAVMKALTELSGK